MDSITPDRHKAGELELATWREQEKTALDLLQVAGELRFDRAIDLLLFRNPVYDVPASELIHAHTRSTAYSKRPVRVDLTLSLAHAVVQLPQFRFCKIDLGRLATEWLEESELHDNLDSFVEAKLTAGFSESLRSGEQAPSGRDVVLYGFGRIGRALTRQIIASTGAGNQLRLRAVVLRGKLQDRHLELKKRAALLRDDSIHGTFSGMVDVAADGSGLFVNGNLIRFIFAEAPEAVDYRDYGIEEALLIDNTGVWRNRQGLERHLRPGIRSVLLTAPGNEVPNIVTGINHTAYDWSHVRLASAASCTTNAVAPVLKVLHDALGISRAHIETVHAYTSDQNLLDNFHRKPRRGRAAPLNMVVTSTGAAAAVARVLPELEGKLTGNAVRVPVPNGSLAILNLTVDRAVNADEVNAVVREATLRGPLCEQIYYSVSQEYVSSNAVGQASTSVFDSPSTRVSSDGMGITVYLWYDNEYGYTCQVMRLAKVMADVHRERYM